jgi:LAO/AO transport system kinase
VTAIEAMLSLHAVADGEWRPPIIKTVATTGAGVAELLDTIERFRAHTAASQGTRRRARAEWRMRELIGQRFLAHIEDNVLRAGEFDQILDRIAARETDPYSAVDGIFQRALGTPNRRTR